jgi:hypothetical protein
LGEPPSCDERRCGVRRSGARSQDDRMAPWREGLRAKPPGEARERSPDVKPASEAPRTFHRTRHGVNLTKTRQRRPMGEGARPKGGRMTGARRMSRGFAEGLLASPAISHYHSRYCNVTQMPVEYFQNLAVRGYYGKCTPAGSWADGYKYPRNCG